MAKTLVERLEKILGGVCDHGARRENCLGTGLHQSVVILRRHHTTDDDHNVAASLFGELGLEFRHESEVRCGERRDAEDMNVVFHRLAGGFRRRREQRTNVDVEAEVGKGGGDDLLATIMAILADLGDQQTGAATLCGFEGFDGCANAFDGAGQCRPPACKLR